MIYYDIRNMLYNMYIYICVYVCICCNPMTLILDTPFLWSQNVPNICNLNALLSHGFYVVLNNTRWKGLLYIGDYRCMQSNYAYTSNPKHQEFWLMLGWCFDEGQKYRNTNVQKTLLHSGWEIDASNRTTLELIATWYRSSAIATFSQKVISWSKI